MLDFSALVSVQEADAVRAISLVTLALLAASTLYGAEVYRYVDENGNVGYSDRPVGQNPEPIVVTTYTPIVPSAPPATIEPNAICLSYPRWSIKGSAIKPVMVTSAPTVPIMAARTE